MTYNRDSIPELAIWKGDEDTNSQLKRAAVRSMNIIESFNNKLVAAKEYAKYVVDPNADQTIQRKQTRRKAGESSDDPRVIRRREKLAILESEAEAKRIDYEKHGTRSQYAEEFLKLV